MLVSDKKALRQHCKAVRNSIRCCEKAEMDERIFSLFTASDFFNNFSTFLIYVSFGSEADTRCIIDFALKSGKRVAVPYCRGENMLFYQINSLNDLIRGAFYIPTVDISKAVEITDFSDSLCIVPALAFDLSGNRLGYGGGYYDRFLSQNRVPTLGLCYEKCIISQIPAESFDIKINCILTENQFRNSK